MENPSYLELIERRLGLLEELGKSLAEGRADFLKPDLEAIKQRIAEQQEICNRLRALDRDLVRAGQHYRTQVSIRADLKALGGWQGSDSKNDRIREVLQRMAETQASVKRLNDTHRSMLRRSRRTVTALQNLANSRSPIYTVPRLLGAAQFDEQRAG